MRMFVWRNSDFGKSSNYLASRIGKHSWISRPGYPFLPKFPTTGLHACCRSSPTKVLISQWASPSQNQSIQDANQEPQRLLMDNKAEERSVV
jgi:hypothetical protein